MTEQRLSERSLFEVAIEKSSPEERAAYLDHACGSDAGLRQEIEALLAVHDRLGHVSAPGHADNLRVTVDDPIRERPGTVIGPYKLMEQIGEGGMGLVFVAEQQQPLRRKVALKVIKPGMDTRQVIARFEAERQVLALMDHPNIARVHDGGETATGRPYFVMELVKGVPITEYCDQNRVPIRQRLELFVDVCQAVQHAHQKGIIHRDIKPSNVLVVSHDGTPVVKVIDFGVAKATGQKLTDKTMYTQFSQMVGTPLYMSPEQAGQSGLDVDTRSDIYALGVLLYELLTGTTPFDKERLREADYDELRRIIREEEPPRPSTRISTLGQAATIVSAQRQSDPRRLSQLCRGELDWIVMKAMEKDRNRRYETASAYAADVQRYLRDEPVQACPPSAWYRFRKFARRNKTALAAAVLALFILAVLGSGGGWIILDRAAREQRLAGQVELILHDVDRLEQDQKWPEALAAGERAQAVLASGEAASALRRRVADVRRDLAFVARLDRIRQDRGSSAEGKGFDNRRAARDYLAAFREYGVDAERLPAETAVAALHARPALAALLAAALDDWVAVGRALDEGEQSWAPLVVVARGIDPDPLRDRLRAMWGRPVTPELQADLRQLAESINVRTQSAATVNALARTLTSAGLPDSAVQVLRDGQRAHPGDFWLNFDLAKALSTRNDHAEAIRYDTVAVSIRPDSAAAHSNLGSALRAQGQLDEAIAEHRKAIELDRKLALPHTNLGNALHDQGKLDAAVAEYSKAIELDPKDARPHTNLGVALHDQGKLDAAVAEYSKAIELDPKDAHAHANLGLALHDQGQLDEAIAECREAIELDPKLAAPHTTLGSALHDQGQLDEAIAECRKAIELDRKDARAHTNLGNALRAQGQLDEAIAEHRKAIELDPKDALPHNNLGVALHAQGKLDAAVAEHRKAIELDHPKLADVHYNLGIALSRQGKLDEAVAAYRQAIALKPSHAEAHCNLGIVLVRQGEFRKALEEARCGHELGSKDPRWPYPSARWVQQCERLVQLDEKLPSILAGKTTPANAAERIELASLCSLKRLHSTAVRFYEEALTAEPKLGEKPELPHRYNAACAAALAGCGQGRDADKLGEKERPRLRQRSLDWLRADLEAKRLLWEKDANQAGADLRKQMQHWLLDPDFAGVRGPEHLAKLPEAERQAWQKLWKDVADMLKQAQEKAAPQKR
jgi:serine/threonine-protein kinase